MMRQYLPFLIALGCMKNDDSEDQLAPWVSFSDRDDVEDGDGSNPDGGSGNGDGGGSDGDGSDESSDDPDGDNDGDGFTNAEEEEAGTNPNYGYSRPYTGDYNVGFCETPPESTGPTGEGLYTYADGSQVTWPSLAIGDVPHNMTFVDQHGEEVDLYSFCGKHVMIVVSAGWCPSCRGFAEYAQGVQDSYREAGLQMVTLITNNNTQGQAPDRAFVQAWADQYDFEDIPVLALDLPYREGTAEEFYDHPTFWFDKDAYTPSIYHLNENMEVISADQSVHDPGYWL